MCAKIRVEVRLQLGIGENYYFSGRSICFYHFLYRTVFRHNSGIVHENSWAIHHQCITCHVRSIVGAVRWKQNRALLANESQSFHTKRRTHPIRSFFKPFSSIIYNFNFLRRFCSSLVSLHISSFL